jgi:hypothetical protein
MRHLILAAMISIAALAAAEKPGKSVLGTVTKFKMDALQIGVQPDDGKAVMVTVALETEVVQVPPGEHDLQHAKPARMTDLAIGDRVLVSFVHDMKAARRIVVISATEIAARNEAVRADWQKRGISGVVAAKNGRRISLELRAPGSVKTIEVAIGDSVKFSEAEPSSVAEIAVGDQVKVRGERDGDTVFAEDVAFGTFLTKVGKITSVDMETRVFQIEEVETKSPLTVKVNAASKLRNLAGAKPPEGAEGHGQPAPAGFDIAQNLDRLPAARMEDLTSTRGAKSGEVTAIMVLANAGFLIQMAQMQAGKGATVTSALGNLHDGMLGGPAGLSLPALIP